MSIGSQPKSIGIEHKLKGYLSRIEKIKADGTREVISADIEVPNTIVNLGRRMVSGEWIHRDAGNPVSNEYSRNRITYFENCSFPFDFSSRMTAPNCTQMSTASEKQYDRDTTQQTAGIFTPGSIVCLSTDGRDTSLDDIFTDYLDSIVENSIGNVTEWNLVYYPASTNSRFDNSTVKPYEYFGVDNSADDYLDILRRRTMRSVAVTANTTIRSVLMCAKKQNVGWPHRNFSHEDNNYQLFSRIVLPEPITLDVGERLMITYDFHIMVNKQEVLGTMNGINYSLRPYVRCGRYDNSDSFGVFSNYHPGYGYSNYLNRSEGFAAPNSSDKTTANFMYSMTNIPLFYIDDIASLLSANSAYNASWNTSYSSYEPQRALNTSQTYPKSGVMTTSFHNSPSIFIENKYSMNSISNRINPQKPVSCYNGNIYSQNYPGCPETMMRGLDWRLTEDGKATFETCYAVQAAAGAMNIYGLLAHGAIVCFGKYDENGTWVDEPIVKSATQKAMISLKTVWNFD